MPRSSSSAEVSNESPPNERADEDAVEAQGDVKKAAGELSATPEILVDRTVIHDSLLRNAVYRESKYYFDPNRVPSESEIDLAAVENLVLSYRNIFAIANLSGFNRLVKLQLDNNNIESLGSGLASLTSLRWLDLSFNKIAELGSSLSNLVNLEDLSLFNNRLSHIENSSLSNLRHLKCLSLGSNNLSDLSLIKNFRKFQHLKLLVLKGNPMAQLDDYHNSVFSYLNQLKYLDYILIESSQFARARDTKLDILLLLEQKEKQDEVEEKAAAAKRLSESKLVQANLEGISSLFGDMIQSDSEHNKIKLLPGYSLLFNQFSYHFSDLLQTFNIDILAKMELKNQEFNCFQAVVEELNSAAESESRLAVGKFDKSKKIVFQKYETQFANGNTNSLNQKPVTIIDALKELKGDLSCCVENLMEIEMLLVERMNNLLEEFDRSYSKLINENILRIGLCFRNLLDLSNKHLNSIYELSHNLLDKLARDELSMEDSFVDIRALLSDKDILNNAISSSHENQDGKILAMEDLIREREENAGKNLVKELRKSEYLRNRHRVAEIYEFRAREEAAIEEKIEFAEEQDRADE